MESRARRKLAAVGALALLMIAVGPAAAEVAEYRVTFDATWSAGTHPGAYPTGAHFSPPVGGTHDATVTFWQTGSLASDAIEQMAEEGASAPLANEVALAIIQGSAFSQIAANGLTSPGMVQATFLVNESHPLVTLVTMVAPSPDWFLGVSGLSLRSGAAWLDPVVHDLFSYDAGTDSGTAFTSGNDDTDPADPVSLITAAPFGGLSRLGTFTFDLVRVLAACEDTIDNDGDGLIDFPDDPGCDSASDPSEQSPSIACDDGLDNDLDLAVDTDDPGCDDSADTSEKSPALICDDGVDNDDDMLIDFPQDDGCSSLLDATEGSVGGTNLPGLSPLGLMGLAALLGVAGLRRTRARRD